MDAVDWTGLSVLAGVVLMAIGYLARQLNRMDLKIDRLDLRIDAKFDGLRSEIEAKIDGLRAEIVPRLDRLEERYVRHLELHAGHIT
jgi:hypothetical protein